MGARTWTWQDVAAAAILRDDWSALVEQVRAGLALVGLADERGDRPSDEDIESAGEEFRYERELIAAEEMEAWLDASRLSLDSWTDYLERAVLRETRADDLAEALEEFAPEGTDIAENLLVEGVCSGALSRFAAALAGRLALCEASGLAPGGAPPKKVAAAERRLAAALAEAGPTGLTAPGADRVAELVRLDGAFENACAGLATPSARRALIEARRLDWVRVEIRDLSFDEESAAREASLCARNDGETLESIAESAHRPARSAHVFLEDLDPAARPAVLSAGPGELVGPLRWGDVFHLLRVDSKTQPTDADPEVRRRAEASLVSAAVDQERQARVRFLESL